MTTDNVLLADGFERAFIGFGRQFTKVLAIYDYKECIEVLIEEASLSEQEAVEYFEYNVIGSYVGESTPIFI